ncbi:MAG: hypothetical protein K2M60_06940 [Lachnospiraceae bacterium]|nr:hypothetical protein [Lachnospiraceae bacterium]MDE6253265.1 hypothetical protein [Lachnospiraceae bacterium]
MKVSNIICNVFIILFLTLCLICILWIHVGSLEMYPTVETEGKARIAAIVGAVIFGVSTSVCVIIKKKCTK